MTTEKKIEIQGIEPVILFGPFDAYLKTIRNAYQDVQITARGSTIHLKGNDEEVAVLEKIFREMIFLADKNGEILENDIKALINLALSPAPGIKPAAPGDEDIIVASADYAVRAKTNGQRRMVAEARNNDILFAIGPAGTGKTYTAVAIAVAAWKAKQVKRIVLARPAVEAGESLGFLPGDLAQKIDPYLRPLYDALQDMLTAEKLKLLTERRIIEIVPLAYMRGRTLNNSFIILDEAQNASGKQMKMCLTRLGINSKAIITGDVTQIDLPTTMESGLPSAEKILKNIKGISFVYLDKSDVVRHKLVRDIINAYEIHESK
ncbi:MAG: PhoH family protein [Chlorobium sp.]|uniref:PhoH family protein n=1 Tax=Chlorobium sp. TaxID=1095 RepID=UPI001D9A5DF0|nr:PhoH family protein [Chlorobium sp.]MBN1279734.1 PhoH family protein [Chlorobiaceae bacterium]MCF8215979.1 PhoH family protein [Chlorobium sp.]MCF8270488.1 PhoH family protein [Chlorobium sp.]MCF8287254.1 PhoH family protein [Chlorobium sp.]MCF8290456.1 PhoH family protein [Chlorobium sp.]